MSELELLYAVTRLADAEQETDDLYADAAVLDVEKRLADARVARLRAEVERIQKAQEDRQAVGEGGTANDLSGVVKALVNTPTGMRFELGAGKYCFDQHKKQARSLVINPGNPDSFATSGMDGVINLWNVTEVAGVRGVSHGVEINALSTTVAKRGWPEEMVWSKSGGTLFCVYGMGEGGRPVSVVSPLAVAGAPQVEFLGNPSHEQGAVVNSLAVIPWIANGFVTCGTDKAVYAWQQDHASMAWSTERLHKRQHNGSIVGVGCLASEFKVVSVASDKKIAVCDYVTKKITETYRSPTLCMDVVPNPHDNKLFLVYTRTNRKQLMLFDLRKPLPVHEFGWDQPSLTSNSKQDWSSDGRLITSGSSNSCVRVFDIRYDRSLDIAVHPDCGQIFKATWNCPRMLLISISGKHKLGLHPIQFPLLF